MQILTALVTFAVNQCGIVLNWHHQYFEIGIFKQVIISFKLVRSLHSAKVKGNFFVVSESYFEVKQSADKIVYRPRHSDLVQTSLIHLLGPVFHCSDQLAFKSPKTM